MKMKARKQLVKCMEIMILTVVMFFNSSLTCFACDNERTNTYVKKILFGDNIYSFENDKKLEQLESALYLCSEQSNKDGQEKLNLLRKAKVGKLPTIAELNVSASNLYECSHRGWNTESKTNKAAQIERKSVLRQTVVKVFDFGWFNEKLKTSSGQIDSFSALLYYTHILADYLSDDPEETEISVNGVEAPAYTGEAFYILNGDKPNFTSKQKKQTESYKEHNPLDELDRAGRGIYCIGPDTLETVEKKTNLPDPIGWIDGNVYYKEEGLTSNELYNRCHLVARELGGANLNINLITGTRYMNEAMIKYENKVANHVKKTGNHVMYRATPIYKGNNLVASGVQLEAYSVEDKGALSFNVYIYNVQPGIDINYENGDNEVADKTLNNDDIIPFAIVNPNDQSPDLMYEIGKQLEILFNNQKENADYKSMMNELKSVADEARVKGEASTVKEYQVYKKIQYEYVEILSEYVPKLLKREKFFNSTFTN